MAHARKRLPIDASAKCNGTRSGVSIIRTSSVANVADRLISSHSYKLTFSHLDQHCMIRADHDFEISLRPSLTININTALLDNTSRFSHRRHQPELNQKLR